MTGPPLHLFEGFGIEIEYMIAQRDSLAVLPVTDEVLRSVAGVYVSEIELGDLHWSNELVLHVIELKTSGPAPDLAPLAALFQEHVRRINTMLEPAAGLLLPTGMHPWMDPHRETRLWPHEYSAVYESYNRIFDCRGHGWANLQSTHINLPFQGDEEFCRLHSAIRLLLPLLPALAASSPFADASWTGYHDFRLRTYQDNSRRIPAVTGRVIPEYVASADEYQQKILQPIYDALSPHDPDGILRYEWVNARGAIARFDRNTIEIRVLDVQECPRADLALARLIVEVLRALSEEKWSPLRAQGRFSVDELRAIYDLTVRDGASALIENADYLEALGRTGAGIRAGALWESLGRELLDPHQFTGELAVLDRIAREGDLAARMLTWTGKHPSRSELEAVYRQLADCLASGSLFPAG